MSKSIYKHIIRELKPETNLDLIRAYVISDGQGIKLTEDQQRQLVILNFTDEQLRTKQGLLNRFSIAQIISKRFELTIRSAQKYITMAEDLYSSSNPLNKRYKVQLRIEHCERNIEMLEQMGDYESAAYWEKILQKYIEMYPDTKVKRTIRNVTYNLPSGAVTAVEQEMSVETAVAELSNAKMPEEEEEFADEQ